MSNSTSPSGPDEHASSPMATIDPTPRSTTRGRPRVTTGAFECSRCQRMANKLRAYWPGDQLCHSCFYTAMHTTASARTAGTTAFFPVGEARADPSPVCLMCAGIPGDFTATTCHHEGEIYRRRQCARCALRDDLCKILLHPADLAAMQTLIEVLCGVDRPESILTWKCNQQVWSSSRRNYLPAQMRLTHDGLTASSTGAISITCAACYNTTACSRNGTNTWRARRSGWPPNSKRSPPPRSALLWSIRDLAPPTTTALARPDPANPLRPSAFRETGDHRNRQVPHLARTDSPAHCHRLHTTRCR